MKLDNLTPDQQKEWQNLLNQNEVLREKLRALEMAQNLSQLGESASTILTRSEFIREIARMVAHDERYGGISSLLVLSFDGLLEHKTQLGSSLYDKLIKEVANVLAEKLRACDVIGRTGSDSFSIMLTRCKLEDAEKKAETLVTSIKERLDPLLNGKATISLNYMVSILNDRADLKKV